MYVCLSKFYNKIIYAQRLYCRLTVDLPRTWMQAMAHWPLTAHCHVCPVHPESGSARGLLRHLTATLASAAACSCPRSTAGSTASLNPPLQIISFHLCLRSPTEISRKFTPPIVCLSYVKPLVYNPIAAAHASRGYDSDSRISLLTFCRCLLIFYICCWMHHKDCRHYKFVMFEV